MKLVAIIGILALLLAAAVLYCFQRRGTSPRPGSFYLLVIAVACEALLVSAIAVKSASLDECIKAIYVHAHGGRTGPYTGKSEPGARQPHYCHIISSANLLMHREYPLLLLARRPTQGVRSQQERFDEAEFESKLQRAWSPMGRAKGLEVIRGPANNRGHTYFVEHSIRFFKQL